MLKAMVERANLFEIPRQIIKECLLSVGFVTTTDLQRVEDKLDDLLRMVEDLQPKNETSAAVSETPVGPPPHSADN